MKKKIIGIVLMGIMICFIFTGFSYAAESSDEEPTETPPFSSGSWINADDYNPGLMQGADKIKDVGNKIIGVFQFVGTCASVIVVSIIGIKYMIGSVEEKAEYKKTMWPYIVGAILVFGITNLLPIIYTLAKQIGR
jgi:amino acid transporter